ncbi:hypothetical protein BT63DRAFT_426201 [Microthyrium microscopicum]|uniref:Uncharacterized protein n=1 Tax=Microthyrium microscopicum TaxID=703497 RepID=A0A6A6U6U5_9PEZI|nr:hypothetical protein BT63DRAFT_426201 [Microthyrium microscopicum]
MLGKQYSLHGAYYNALSSKPMAHGGHEGHGAEGHMGHCFDYLRQVLMCAADTNMEPLGADLGGASGWGSERTCRDYDAVVRWASKNRMSIDKYRTSG